MQGIEGAKPRLPAAENGQVTKEELSALNHEYLRTRNSAMASKAAVAAMELQRRRGELISKHMARLEAAFLVTALRQRMQAEPAPLARRLVAGGFLEEKHLHAVGEMIKATLLAMLVEFAELPGKLGDPNWQDQIDADLRARVDGAGARETDTPSRAKAQAAKAEIRAARRLEQQRQRRAEGA
jgi:hypothetical protein